MTAALPLARHDDQVRADCYRVLARLFAAAPDAALLQTLADAPRASDDALGMAWNALCALAARSGSDAAVVQRLQAEYTDLFFSVGEPRVMLYASWYLSGSLMDRPLADLRDDLARLGFEREPDVREPEDHLAALLEVMAMLVSDGRSEQTEFLRRHLTPWYALLCGRLEAENSEFYGAVARFARCYLAGESELPAR